jgi:hypothetical protein
MTMSYELADYLLANPPAKERALTVASLRRPNAVGFPWMRSMVVSRALQPAVIDDEPHI